MKFSLFLIAAGCSALAAACFLIFQVEQGATTNAVGQYVLAGLLAFALPLVTVLVMRLLTPARSYLAGALAWIAVAAGTGGLFGVLLLR